ncbi:MAG: signal transduction histidine kinase regulating C4-dicarboxylate transport [Desulfobulbaceae bacterium]|nr:MAG: signal transduction histidine kinase regulating C4-dicarboxylate transport [Desulfobulbaceae bacterium]
MRSKGIKSQLTITLAVLLTIGMVLINLVVTIFWQRSLMGAEMEKARSVLSIVADMSEKSPSFEETFSPQALEHLRQSLDASCIMFATAAGVAASSPGKCVPQDIILQEKLRQVISTGTETTSTIGTGPDIPLFSRLRIVLAIPIQLNGTQQGAIGAVISLQSVYEQVGQGRYIAYIYILVNVIILTTIGLFRLVQVVVRPIENLVTLTNTYQNDENIPFLSDQESNEFGQLSIALHRMLHRIDNDRRKLQETVHSLEGANQQLRTTQQQMVQTEKMAAIGRLAAGLAHEIGNPIGIIQGYVEMLGQPELSTEEQEQFSRRSLQELERINHLIHQLLNFSRTRANNAGNTLIHPLLQELVTMLQAQKKSATIDFQLHLDAEHDLVTAGSEGLHQVFLNCLLNAIDAINDAIQKFGNLHQGKIHLTTSNTTNIEGKPFIEISLKDNGIGIKEEDIGSLFDPFFTTKEPGKGTGLGLAVSYALVEGVGGQMRIKGQEGQGATVFILLPLSANT